MEIISSKELLILSFDNETTAHLNLPEANHSTAAINSKPSPTIFEPYALHTPYYLAMHVTPIVCLAMSIMVSGGLLIHLLPPLRLFYTRKIGERLVVYLAGCDLLFSISHTIDHADMLAAQANPPDDACATFAFFLNEFTIAGALIVTFTAVNAFFMVVVQRRIHLGPRDWRLVVYALGLPAIIGVLGVSTKSFGPSGMWCYVDMRRPLGQILTNILGIIFIITFGVNFILYGGIWLKVRSVGKKALANSSSATDSQTKYHKTAKVMMIFVAVFILQWWAYVTYSVWDLVSSPPFGMRWMAVFFTNLGGVFNFLTFFFVRRNNMSNATKVTPGGESVVKGNAAKNGKEVVSRNNNKISVVGTGTTVTTA